MTTEASKIDIPKLTPSKLAGLPWRACLAVLGSSFLTASLLSTVLAKVFLPGDGKPLTRTSLAATTITVPNPTASLNQASVNAILKRNIFNSEGSALEDVKKDDPTATQQVEAVKSDLPVKLVGTIYGGDPLSGLALVENNAKKTINSFMVGDVLLKDATVKEVHREKIIIDRAGRLEFIEVDKTELSRSRRQKKSAPSASSNQGIAPIATEPPPSSFKEEGFERKEKESAMTSAYRTKLLTTDFTKVLQDAKATPNMVDGELKGFTLTRIRKDSIYEKAGFQNDDVVTEVNGVPLTDTAQSIRLLQSLRNESEIEIRILRGGSPQTFTLKVQ